MGKLNLPTLESGTLWETEQYHPWNPEPHVTLNISPLESGASWETEHTPVKKTGFFANISKKMDLFANLHFLF